MTNASILAAFERMWQHIIAKMDATANHTHDDLYYTETEIDTKLSEVNTSISNIVDGTTTVGKAATATTAEKATQDGAGNVIVDTYETKSDSTAKLTEAKSYADTLNAAMDAKVTANAEAIGTFTECSEEDILSFFE